MSGTEDLSRHHHELLKEGTELHPQNQVSLCFMSLAPSRCDGKHECEPCLESPCERGDQHVGPVGIECIQRCVQGTGAVFELIDEILLITAMVGLGNDLPRLHGSVVRDVEHVAIYLVEATLATLLKNALAHDDHAIGPLRPSRLVLELGDILRE